MKNKKINLTDYGIRESCGCILEAEPFYGHPNYEETLFLKPYLFKIRCPGHQRSPAMWRNITKKLRKSFYFNEK